jgi:uncharacterized protein with FMN-binding domain
LFAGLSIGGAVLVNDLVLNPGASIIGTVTGNTSASGSSASSAPKTATGDAIDYMYGTVQLKITKENGKITKIEEVQATATAGREQAFPYLNKYAVQANGSSFGNLSGATYTTDAYKQAIDSALSKLN